MSRYSLEETRRQLQDVPGDLLALAPYLGNLRPTGAKQILLCGNGDSHAAALMVAASAPDRIKVVYPWQLSTEAIRPGADDLVVLVSASGTSDAIVEVARMLAATPTTVLGVTGNDTSELALSVDTPCVWTLGPAALGPSPAVRTFASTYLFLAALCGLPNSLDGIKSVNGDSSTVANLTATLRQAADLAAWLVGDQVRSPTYLATGQYFGAAEFARSKSIEISGVNAIASDPGEWFHVDRHSAPPFGPLIVFSSTPPAHHLKICLEAGLDQGRRVAVIAPGGGDDPWRTLGLTLLPPFLQPLAAALVGAYVGLRQAELLGRRPFSNQID